MYYSILLFLFLGVQQPPAPKNETTLIGVFQGVSLFIQNPYNSDSKEFCVKKVYVNNQLQPLNYKLSALKLDFLQSDLYTPVTIKIVARDSICQPQIINPDAVLFHTSYKFTSMSLSDSVFTWQTEGERESGTYFIEKLQTGIWVTEEEIPAQGRFEEAKYLYFPALDEGPNKYRIKYEFGNGKYLYSQEIEYEFYPEPVKFKPQATNTTIYLSRAAAYEVYNQKGNLVLSGRGLEIDVRRIRPGEYIVYFDGKDPGVFRREY
ncbi:MAG: hypothetical protein KI790_01095 [Cyclobacteriaceae bacterium]|nr:hypothetical protein [Cyclobacteriaceae bacterium HetDA_MAG_MS6]